MANGFTATNWKKKLMGMPSEDAYMTRGNIIAVADGVTRDPMQYLPNLETLMGKARFAFHYPRPSPARIAADIFAETFCDFLRDYIVSNRNEKVIRGAFEEANKRIGKWNEDNICSVDYLINDFAGCVAAGISRNKAALSFGYLTDCGIAIFDENGNLKFRTENQGPDKHDKYIWQDERLRDISWRNPKARKIIRSEYRNNPSEEHSFGVLTGEDSAMHYVRTGTEEIKPEEHLIVYSDGLEPIIFSGEFSDLLRKKDIKGMEKLCRKKVKTEGTLVYDCINVAKFK